MNSTAVNFSTITISYSLTLIQHIISPRELSEVDRYSQSLDKCRFVDAKDRLGPETEQFANFLKALRDNPSLIAIIFLTDSHTRGNAQQLSELIHITLSTAYGFGVLPSDEKRLIQVPIKYSFTQL